MNIGVLLSGGVDSSVALLSISHQYPQAQITAYYLKIWLEDELQTLGQCPWEDDLKFARQVCEQTSVPLKVINLQKEYLERVVHYTISELKSGRTPSPDILCNARIKFAAFLERVDNRLDKIVTGHYALIRQTENGQFQILRSPDPVKDQTYFLSHISQQQASHLLFPIGAFTKKEVRKLAMKHDLPNKMRKDSQGICFLGKIKYPDFVRHYLGEKNGNIVDIDTGQVLGEHKGTWFYTIGQRSGLGLSGGPWYVVDKAMNTNTVFVAQTQTAIQTAPDRFVAINPNWISGHPPEFPAKVTMKLRHGPHLIGGQIEMTNAEIYVQMDESDRGIASGQFAVFYDGLECLGGAMISRVI